MTQSASIFEDLREYSWRGIGFPYSKTSFSFRQDQTKHSWADRDGAHVEGTGRDVLVFDVVVPMRNGIAPGRNETWQGPLYPTLFRTFLAACIDRTSGDLNHPEFGLINCKCETFSCDWDPNKRDGVDINVRWVESTDSADGLAQTIASPSPIATAVQFGADLDSQIADVPNIPPQPTFEPSFGDAMRSIQAIGDQTLLASRQVQGQIDHVLYRVQGIEDSVTALGSAQNWPIINSCERMKAALADLKKTMLVANKLIRIYVTPNILTLAQICVATSSRIVDILALNPLLAGNVTVPANTPVRHYTL